MDLNIGTGLKEYNLNGAVKVYFNPTDAGFAEKVVNTFTGLEGKQDVYRKELSEAKTPADVFAVAHKWDSDIRSMIDSAFGVPVCQAVFGDMNVYALADGLPVWMNLMFAVMDEISAGFENIGEEIPAKIRAYTDKYKGKR